MGNPHDEKKTPSGSEIHSSAAHDGLDDDTPFKNGGRTKRGWAMSDPEFRWTEFQRGGGPVINTMIYTQKKCDSAHSFCHCHITQEDSPKSSNICFYNNDKEWDHGKNSFIPPGKKNTKETNSTLSPSWDSQWYIIGLLLIVQPSLIHHQYPPRYRCFTQKWSQNNFNYFSHLDSVLFQTNPWFDHPTIMYYQCRYHDSKMNTP